MSITRSSPVQVAAYTTTYSQAPKLVSTSWSKISVGPSHVLAIKSNNTLYAWGIGTSGQLGDGFAISRSSPVQIGNPSYTWNDISAGPNFSVGLRGDGLLFAWGVNTAGVLGDLNVPIGATRSSPNQIGTSSWNAISAGGTHIVAIRSDKSLWSWGLNTVGQLGNGDYYNRSSPVQISTSSWISVSAGQTHTTAITSDYRLFTWGDNTVGTLGYTTPAQSYFSWTSVAGNADYTVAIRNDGLLFAWGTNNFGQLGDFTTINRSSPVQIGTSSWLVVSAQAPTGGGPVLAIRSDGTLWGWGYNVAGGLGVGDTAYRSSPVQVSGGGSWISVSAGKSHTIALKSDYKLYTWGLGTSGQLGDGLVSRSSPLLVGTSSWTKVSSGELASYAIRLDGGLFAWGANTNGQQGDPTIATNVLRSSPTQIGNNSWTNVFAYGTSFVHAIDSNSKLFGWGANGGAQLGVGDANPRSSPVQISSGNWSTLGGYGSITNTLGIQTDGSLWGWGSKSNLLLGEFSNASYTFSWSQVSAGPSHTAAIRSDGRLFTWGLNSVGQFGSGTTNNSQSPILVNVSVGVNDFWNRVSVNGLRTIAIRNDSTLWSWGSNAGLLLGDKTGATRSFPTQIGFNTGSALSFNGSNQYLDIATNTSGNFTTGNFTIEFWAYPTVNNRQDWIDFNDGATRLLIYYTGTNIAYFGSGSDRVVANAMILNQWQHIAVSRVSGSTRIFINGLQSGSTFAGDTINYPAQRLTIGKDGSGLTYVTGYMAGIRILRGVGLYTTNFGVPSVPPVLVTGSTILLLTSSTTDSSGTITLTNNNSVGVTTSITPFFDTTSFTQISAGLSHSLAITSLGKLYSWGDNTYRQLGYSTDYSILFNGTTDYLTLPAGTAFTFGTGDFTIECWIYLNGTAGNYAIFDARTAGSAVSINFYFQGTNNLSLMVSGVNRIAQGSALSASIWHHVALSRVSGSTRMFVDGLQAGATYTDANSYNQGIPTIGRNAIAGGGSNFFPGYITNIRVVKGQGLYTSNFTPSTTSLTTTSQGISSGTVSLLALQNSTIIDNSGNNVTITSVGTPTIQPFSVFGISPTQVGSSSWSQVSSYGTHSLGIDINNKLYSWGENTAGQIGVGASPYFWTSVATSTQNGPVYAIRNDGGLWGWGLNTSGSLGDGTGASKSSPVQIGTSSWSMITSGLSHVLAIRADGTLWGWGGNGSGQLTSNPVLVGGARSSPVQIGTSSWLFVAAGQNSSFGITSDYKLFAWGYNGLGVLGDSTTVNKSSPVQIGSSSWTSVATYGLGTNTNYSIGLLADGTIYTWGYNASGQLGDGTTVNKSSPIQVGTSSWKLVANMYTASFAIRGDDTLWGWGLNSFGQLADNTIVSKSSPIQISVGNYFKTISGGDNGGAGPVYAIRTDGTLYSWGPNQNGAGGINLYVAGSDYRSNPTQIGGLSWLTVKAMGLGGIGITTGSSSQPNLYTWGDNTNGVLGTNDTASRSSPTQIGAGTLTQAISSPTQIGTDSWTSVSAGLSNSMAIRSDYKLFTWGDNSQRQSGYITPATALGTASNTNNNAQSYVRSTDNALIIWGANDVGQLGDNTIINRSSPVQLGLGLGASQYTKIARAKVATAGYTLGVQTNGSLWAWGSGIGGRLGLADTINRSSPTQVGTLTTWSDVAAGPSHALAIKTDGSLWGWGLNTSGQAGVLSWTNVSSGSSHTLAIRSDGTLWGWGKNDFGQVGDISIITRSSPVQLGTGSFRQVYAGIDISAAIRGDSTLWTWGLNTIGQLGQSDVANRSSPTQIGTAFTSLSWIQISARDYMAGITSDYRLFTWGSNAGYQLGNGTTAPRSSPVQINAGTSSYTYVSAGGSFMASIRSDGRLFLWGTNTNGQLGLGDVALRSQPTQIDSTTSWSIVSTSNNAHALAITTDSKLYAWGLNNQSQLGLGDTTYRSSPVQIGTSSWSTVSAGTNFSLGLQTNNTVWAWGSGPSGQLGIINPLSWTIGNGIVIHANDGTLWNWGDNTLGQLGISSTQFRSSPVQIGTTSWTYTYSTTSNAYAIKSDGTMWSWGTNYVGQLGLGDTTNRSSPVQIGSDTNWSTVVASATGHALALKTTGTLWAWGNNSYNELGQNQRIQLHVSVPVQVGTSSWTKISAGNNNSFAIRSGDTALFTWGRNDWGQTGLNNIALSWTSVAGGDSFSVAIRSDGKLYSWGLNNKGQLGLGHTVSKSAPTQIGISTNSAYYSTSFTSTDSLTIPTNAGFVFGTGDFTIEAWFYITSGTSAVIFDTRAGAVGVTPLLYINTLALRYYINGGDQITSTTTLVLNTWYHVALVRSSSSSKMYLNGLQTGNTYADTNNFTLTNTITIGRGNDASNSLTGYITSLRVLKGQALYTNTFLPSTIPVTTTSQGAVAANVSLLTCQNDRYIDNSTASVKTITPVGTGIFTSTITPFVYTAQSNYSFTQVSTILSHTVAIRNDGTLWTWGANDNGQLGQSDIANRSIPVQIGSSSWTNVFAGFNASYAIRTDGALFTVGDNTYGQLGQGDGIKRSDITQIPGTTSWTTLSASQTGHVLGIANTGALYVWGNNSYNELGIDTGVSSAFNPYTLHRSSPVQVGTSSWTKVSAGNSFSAAIRSDSTLWTWGRNDQGQLGIVNTLSFASVAPTNLIRSDGKAYGWGYGSSGDGTTILRSNPTQVATGNSWTSIAYGYSTGPRIAIRTDGQLWQFGGNTTSPVVLDSGSWIAVAASSNGGAWYMAIKSNYTVYSWGINPQGQLGQGDTASRGAPTLISGLPTKSWTQISAGLRHGYALASDGTLYGWGDNGGGALGDGTTISKSAPIQIAGDTSWTAVAAGNSHTIAIRTSDKALFGWGFNSSGQVGDATVVSKSSPVKVGSSSWAVVNAQAGGQTSYGIDIAGKLYSWGSNLFGALGGSSTLALGTTVTRNTPVQFGPAGISWTQVVGQGDGGGYTAIAFSTTKTVYTWGDNAGGQLGDGTNISRSAPVQIGATLLTGLMQDIYKSPTQVGALATWTQIQAGTSWTAGTSSTGALFMWGGSTNYELGVGTTAGRSSPVQLGALLYSTLSGTSNPLAIQTTTGNLFGWGVQAAGQLGQNDTALRSSPVQIGSLTGQVFDNVSSPTQLGSSSWTQVSAGDYHTYAIRSDSGLFSWGRNDQGQLGQNIATTIHRSSPVQIGAGTWSAISAGNLFGAAVTSLGNLQTTGYNLFGQQGAATTVNRSAFTAVGTSSWTSVSASKDIVFAVDINNRLFAWGNNNLGQLGTDDTVQRSSPVQVGTNYQTMFSNPTQIGSAPLTNGYSVNFSSTGATDALVIPHNTALDLTSGDFTIECWSYVTSVASNDYILNKSGASSTNVGAYTIQYRTADSTWSFTTSDSTGAATGTFYTFGTGSNTNNTWLHFAVTRSGTTIKTFLNGTLITNVTQGTAINDRGQVLTIGNQINAGAPLKGYVSNLRIVKGQALYTANFTPSTTQLTTTSQSAIAGNVSLLTCQSTSFVDNSTNNFPVYQIGTPLINSPYYSQISAGSSHSTTIQSNGLLFNTGDNVSGTLGDSTTINKTFALPIAYPTLYDNRSSPAQIGTGSWSQIAAGLNYSIALKSDGTLYTWGDNTNGYLGDGTTLTRRSMTQIGTSSYISISSGGSHTVALKNDLTLYAWGLNNAGQLGDNSVVSRSSPVQVNTGLVTSWNFVSAGASHTSAIDATNNLPYGWGLNSSGQIGDNTLVNKSAPVQVSAGTASNYSYQFNGTTQYLSVAANTAFAFGTGDFTIEFWFNGASQLNKFFYDNRAGSASTTYPHITTGTSTSTLRWGPTNTSGTIIIGNNSWHHCAVTRQSGTVKLWVDGVLDTSVSDTTNYSINYPVYIGSNSYTPPSNPISGYISNFRIVKGTALYTSGFYPSTGALTINSQGATASQVSLLTAQSATIVDNSSNAFTITNTGTATVSGTNPFGPYYSGSFNGTTQYIQVANNTANQMGSGDWTAEAWIYITTYSTINAVFAKGGSTTDWFLATNNNNGRLYTGIGTSDYFASTGPIVSLNSWAHVALVRSGTTLSTYLNGVLGNTLTGVTQNFASTGALNLGRGRDSSPNYLTGYISNARLVKGTAVYTGNFTVPTNILRTTQSAMTNIVALTGTETSLLTLQNATIIDNSTNVFTITNNNSVPITTAYAPFSASTAGSVTVWDSIQAGVTSTMGTSNNTLFTWGAGTTGQLGDNTVTGKSAPSTTGVGSIWSVQEKLLSSPVQVGTAKSWSIVAAGAGHTIAMATDYSLWAWGQNNTGQVGDATTVGKSSPTQIAGNTSSYTFITAGVSNTFAIRTTTNLLFVWGFNTIGQLGLTDLVNRSSPVQVTVSTMTSPLIPIRLNTVSGSSFTMVQAGSAASVIDSNGLLYTWGTALTGQTGDNTAINRSSPVQLGGLTGFTYINSPVQVGTSSYSQVSAGNSHTLAIDTNSLLYAWGKTPANGQSVNRSSPVQIGSNSWLNISTGNDLSLATDSTQTLYAWGLNTNYQLGSPSFYLNQSITSPVAIGTLALRQNKSSSGGSNNGGFIKNI